MRQLGQVPGNRVGKLQISTNLGRITAAPDESLAGPRHSLVGDSMQGCLQPPGSSCFVSFTVGEEHSEGGGPLGKVSHQVDLSCGQAGRMLPVPCLVRAVYPPDVGGAGHPQPHFHVVRVRQLALAADLANYGSAHEHLG